MGVQTLPWSTFFMFQYLAEYCVDDAQDSFAALQFKHD